MLRQMYAALALASVSCVAVGAGPAGTVDGSLVVNGRTVHLDHILVVQSGNEEGLDEPGLRIYLSSAEIPLAAGGGASTLRAQTWARHANMTAVVLRADPAARSRAGTASVLAAPGLEPGMFSSMSSNQAYSDLRAAGGRISGATDLGSGTLKVRFDAPVQAVAITQDLKDAAAADSAPAKAYLVYAAALRKGDLNEAGRHATASRMKELSDLRAQAAEIFDSIRKQIPEGGPLARSIRRVIVRGDTASVVLADKNVNELVREGGEWKVD
ncbi:MAG: hypothetical protein ABI641_14450 [Caldimonas sp.]